MSMETVNQLLISLVWVFLEILSLRLFSERFLTGKRNARESMIALTVTGILWGAAACFLNIWALPLSCILAVLWTLYNFEGSWLRKATVALLSCALSVAVTAAVCVVFSLLLAVRFDDPQWRELLRFAVLTAARLIHLFVAFLIRRFHMPNAAKFVFGKGLFLALLFPGISLLLIVFVFHIYHRGGSLADSVILSCGILMITNVAVLYMVSTADKKDKANTELILLNKQMEIQTQGALSLEKSYRAQRKAAHEFRHHLQTLRNLLEQEELAAAKEYVTALQNTHTTRVLCVNSHHPIVDAVLNQKYQAAAEQNIDMQLQVNDLSKLTVDPERLVVVLTNLLDNAIEACERLSENRQIRCRILLGENLFIAVNNTALPVEIRDNTIKSSKMPREEHGYGLPGICSILDGLTAEYAFNYENGWFRFAAEVPLA